MILCIFVDIFWILFLSFTIFARSISFCCFQFFLFYLSFISQTIFLHLYLSPYISLSKKNSLFLFLISLSTPLVPLLDFWMSAVGPLATVYIFTSWYISSHSFPSCSAHGGRWTSTELSTAQGPSRGSGGHILSFFLSTNFFL